MGGEFLFGLSLTGEAEPFCVISGSLGESPFSRMGFAASRSPPGRSTSSDPGT